MTPREELLGLMAQCRAAGVDPIPVMVQELEALGYSVKPPPPPPARPTLVLCTDPDCPQAWAYRDPPRQHWHPLPHGPTLEDYRVGAQTGHWRVDWERFGLVDADIQTELDPDREDRDSQT